MPFLKCSYHTLWVANNTLFHKNITTVGIVNSLLVLPTVVLNILVISAFIKNKKLRKVSNIILISLSVTDLLSGAVIQPVWSGCLFSILKYPYYDFPCGLVVVSGIMGYLFACISLVTVSFISFERYLAIFYPYTHKLCMTRRVIKGTCLILWIVPCPILLGLFFSRIHDVFFGVNGVFISLIYIWNIGIYIRISICVHKVRQQLLLLHRRFSNRTELVTQSKGTRIASGIIVALLVCYLPHVVESLLRVFMNTLFLLEYFEYWTSTMTLLSPCLNPLFYCYYNSEIRNGVCFMLMDTLQKKRRIHFPGVVSFAQQSLETSIRLKARGAENMDHSSKPRSSVSNQIFQASFSRDSIGDLVDSNYSGHSCTDHQDRIEKTDIHITVGSADAVIVTNSSYEKQERETNDVLFHDINEVISNMINEICICMTPDNLGTKNQNIANV